MNDWINAGFELVGSLLCWLNVVRLHRDKRLEGVVWQVQGFFTAWGLWNLWYYPSMGQWASFWGGVMLVLGNGTWVGMAVYYAGTREGSALEAPGHDGTQASAAPCEMPAAKAAAPCEVARQMCLFVGGPLDGKLLDIEGHHVRVGIVISITLPGAESDYGMRTWGIFEWEGPGKEAVTS